MMFSLIKPPISRSTLSFSISRSFKSPPAHLNHKFFQASEASPYNLIVLHGLMGSSNNFRSIITNPSIKSKVNSYLLDLRNHGESEHKPTMEIKEMAADVVNFITKKQLQNLIIMGHSLGGKVVMSIATSFPELYSSLKGVVIMDVAPINYFKDPKRKYVGVLDTLKMLKNINEISFENKSYKELRKEIIDKCPSKDIGELLWTNVNHEKDNKHKWRINLPVILEYYPKLLDFIPNNEKAYQGLIKVMRGSQSEYIMEDHYQSFVEVFKKFNPNSDIITIKDSGHWIHFEKPAVVIKELSDIIDQIKANDK